jgi:acetyl-CoA carboxylase carboxyltransferase component
MPAIASKLAPRSEAFRANAAAMRALVEDLNAKFAQVAQGGGDAARAKHVSRGKLLPRDRVEMLLDPDTPFLEVAPLARSACTRRRTAATPPRAPASSPASAASPASSAWWSATTPR